MCCTGFEFPEGKDEFGRELEHETRRPLLLDATLGGRPRASGCRLLSLPAEVLAEILDALLYDGRAALAALALVNSDCRQLARSAQFVEIRFDYSPRSHQLARHLSQEGTVVEAMSQPPAIATCVRSVKVASHRDWVAQAHPQLFDAVFGLQSAAAYSAEQRHRLEEEAHQVYYNEYRPAVLRAISAMPHLDSVDWHDGPAMDASCFEAITYSPAQHLILRQANLREPYVLEPPLSPAVIPLRSLYLKTQLQGHGSSGSFQDELARKLRHWTPTPDCNVFAESILRRCAATLERLTWHTPDHLIGQEGALPASHEPLEFPRLRHLVLDWIGLQPQHLLSFLSPSLRRLRLCGYSTKMVGRYSALPSCAPLHNLEALAILCLRRAPPEEVDPILPFIENNAHVRELAVGPVKNEMMDTRIIPLLSPKAFTNLTWLLLWWAGLGTEALYDTFEIPEASIAAIGQLVSLRQLLLVGGEHYAPTCQWLIDHDMVRARLAALSNLQRLALCRDTYHCWTGPAASYYQTRVLQTEADLDLARARPDLDEASDDDGVRADGQEDDPWSSDDSDAGRIDGQVLWERAHRNRMLTQAERYAAVMPNLESVYCGQWLMAIEEGGGGKVAVPLSKQRSDWWAWLGDMYVVQPFGHFL
ncbi:hypothetical protein QBC46DRAFT_268549 [Diplogelasinospora grovesii]|uniref:F-box domain-containing protein n=1 Tax=Diplogelasinospora grovesii TaxID=303347 RepID=A0AAN6S1W5_9PEZI|nr:hypothetical protein QBC46DRAFT_268549 [Diplogelasinospora grovesii]